MTSSPEGVVVFLMRSYENNEWRGEEVVNGPPTDLAPSKATVGRFTPLTELVLSDILERFFFYVCNVLRKKSWVFLQRSLQKR